MAHHNPISQNRWAASQKHEQEHWHGQEVLESGLAHARKYYVPLMQRYTENLPEDAAILEIGSGPACISRFIEKGKKTFVDPLLEDFRRAYPGELPEGEFLPIMAENIPRPDHTYDFILCLNTLNYVLNPELVLNEVERLLKTDGIFMLGMEIFSPLGARLHYLLERFSPAMNDEPRLYCYSHHGMVKTLTRHFDIMEQTRIETRKGLLPFTSCEEWVFICKPRT
ncbi:MAG: methyltransferase domain-containing protein [Mariprofundaceae bacterium]|nr:methyltransferase domain-containing protein [Mariprofundaceae bacterium]